MKITLQMGIALLLTLIGVVAMAGTYYHSASVSSGVLILALLCAVVIALAFAIHAWIDLQGQAE